MWRAYKAAFFLLVFSGVTLGQPLHWRKPVSGLVFDRPAGSIRAIVGIPGAAYLSRPLLVEITAAAVAPNSKLALATSRDGMHLLTDAGGPEPMITAVEGSLSAVDRLAWASNSAVAILYSSSSRRFQRLINGETDMRAAGTFDLGVLDGELTALAVDRTGDNIALGLRGASAGIYLISGDLPPRQLDSAILADALTFADDNTLYAVSRTARQIFQIPDPASTSPVLPFAGEHDGLTDPIGLAVSVRQDLLWVINEGPRTLQIFRLSTRELLGETALDFSPSSLLILDNGTRFLVDSRRQSGEPIWVLNASSRLELFFVPGGDSQE